LALPDTAKANRKVGKDYKYMLINKKAGKDYNN
jgi:hypothetical protein